MNGDGTIQAERAAFSDGAETLLLTEVRTEADRVRTFRFRALSGAGFAFRPGQHLTIEVPMPSGTQRRTFTIASPPTRPGHIELTVKAQDGGNATRAMHERLKPGATVKARGPGGDFAIDPAALPRELVLLSAGSGATPMIAIARTLSDLRADLPVHYVHLARRAEDLLFRAELETIASALPRFQLSFLVSADSACGLPNGRPTASRFAALIPSLATADVYACGPSGFIDTAAEAHRLSQGDPGRFHRESFGGTDGAAALPEPAGDRFAVTVAPTGTIFFASPTEPLLAAAHRAGVMIPSSCRNGICGTCRVMKTAGEVEMHHNGGLFDDEEEEGFILACCSYPRTPLSIETA